ncbi:hypothetical protein PG984_016401 [Apiospora sp. TS-2023a]
MVKADRLLKVIQACHAAFVTRPLRDKILLHSFIDEFLYSFLLAYLLAFIIYDSLFCPHYQEKDEEDGESHTYDLPLAAPQPRVLVLLPLLDGVEVLTHNHHLHSGQVTATAGHRRVGKDDHVVSPAVRALVVADGILVPGDLAAAGELLDALAQALLSGEAAAEVVVVPLEYGQGVQGRRRTVVVVVAAARIAVAVLGGSLGDPASSLGEGKGLGDQDVRLELQQAGLAGRLELLLELVQVGIQGAVAGVEQEAVVSRGVSSGARVAVDACHGHGDLGGDEAPGGEPGPILDGAFDFMDIHFGRKVRVRGSILVIQALGGLLVHLVVGVHHAVVVGHFAQVKMS